MPNYLINFQIVCVYITYWRFVLSTEQLLAWNQQGLTLKQISEQFNINYDTLRSRYQTAGIDFISGRKKWDISRLYNCSDVDAQYVIGLLAADGYFHSDREVDIWLQELDIELLYRILNVLNRPDATLHQRVNINGSRQVGIKIGSVELVRFLSSFYGFQPQKSRTLPFPRQLVNPLPFLRGFFDGDGYMGYSCTFTIGSQDFAMGLLEWVNRIYGYTPNVQMCGMNKDIFNIHFRKKHDRFIRDLFSYSGLIRKTEGFLRYLPN